MQELIDITIAHYQLLRRIARGGMADIYLACDAHTNQQVALKLVRCDDIYSARFLREVEAMSALQNKHILPILDYGEHNGWCYLALPYIEPGTLHDRLAQGPLSPQEAGDLLTQLADALQCAHDHGIIHRDIKASNILLKDGKYAYLADFGLAKWIGVENNLTLSGYMIGTADYMAPELAEDKASPLSDIYALGVLLYQMLTGRVPFKGSSPLNVFLKHVGEEPVPPSLLNPAISVAVEEVVLRAMAKEPHARFASARQFAQMYQAALRGEHIPPVEIQIWETLPLPTLTVTRAKQPVSPAKRISRLIMAGIALVFSALLAFGLMATLPGVGQQRILQSGRHTPTQTISTATPTPTPTATATTSVMPPVKTASDTGDQGGGPLLTPGPTHQGPDKNKPEPKPKDDHEPDKPPKDKGPKKP